MATKKRRKKIIRTPKRAPMQTEEEFLLDCVAAAMEQVDLAQDKLSDCVDKLCRARAKLRDVEIACARYVARLEKCRKARVTLHGGITGEGDGLL